MATPISPASPTGAAVRRCVAMAHVIDVERSVTFYGLLGFSCRSRVKDHFGQCNWAHLISPGGSADAAAGAAEIMFARASGPIDAGQQAVLFYMYSDDVQGLREHLLQAGVRNAGRFGAQQEVGAAAGPALHDIIRPFYMPAGELRIHDPDGYVILVGQIG